MVEDARCGDHDVDLVAVAARRLELPAPVLELAARDLVAEADELVDLVLARHALEVGLDLPTRGEAVAPLGIGLERVAVEVGRDVAADPRIGVLPPGAADALGLLVHRDVGEAGLVELDGAHDAGHSLRR